MFGHPKICNNLFKTGTKWYINATKGIANSGDLEETSTLRLHCLSRLISKQFSMKTYDFRINFYANTHFKTIEDYTNCQDLSVQKL